MVNVRTNVMLTCAGRRAYLVQFFREALRGRGQVLAGDVDPAAPALTEAEKTFRLPRVDDPHYIDVLVAICQEHGVRLLIPLHDLELPVLAASAERLIEVGTIPVVSSPSVVATCFDKSATVQFLKEAGLGAPRTYTSLVQAYEALDHGEVAFPLVVKPRWGMASMGIAYPEDRQELQLAYDVTKTRFDRTFLVHGSGADPDKCVLIQERLHGSELGLDVINDLNGRYVCTLARRKLAMRAGETDRAVTLEDGAIEHLGERIGRHLRHVGNLDCDVFVGEAGSSVVDMNPRFGGGYPFSHLAGANLPAALIAWARGEQPDPCWLKVRPNVTGSKCDTLVVVSE